MAVGTSFSYFVLPPLLRWRSTLLTISPHSWMYELMSVMIGGILCFGTLFSFCRPPHESPCQSISPSPPTLQILSAYPSLTNPSPDRMSSKEPGDTSRERLSAKNYFSHRLHLRDLSSPEQMVSSIPFSSHTITTTNWS